MRFNFEIRISKYETIWEVRNPKYEAPNSKQIQMTKIPMHKTSLFQIRNPNTEILNKFEILILKIQNILIRS